MPTPKPTILFAHAPVATLVLSREGQVVDVNNEGLRTLAEKRKRIVGAPVLGFISEEDRLRARENFLSVLSGKEREWSSRCRRADGVIRVQQLKAVPLLPDQGKDVRGVVLFMTDVTQDQAGRPERNQMQDLLEYLPGQFLMTLDESGRIRWASGVSRTHYRSEVDLVGIQYAEILEEGDENRLRATQMMHSLAAGADWAGTHWHVRADGTAFPVRVFARPHRDPRTGRVVGGLIVGRDVSVEYDLRHRLERADRLAQLGAMVGQVGTRIGAATRALEESVEPLLPAANGSGHAVQRSVEGLSNWSSAIVELAHDVQLDRKATRIDPFLERLARERQSRFEDLEVEVVLEGGSDREVSVDSERTYRALLAVVDNALDALNDRPTGRRLTLSIQEGQDGIILRIRDNGPGIPDDLRECVYDPFFTTREGRPGLGLSRAREQVKSQGGRLWFTSNGGGTTMAVELPYEAPEASFPFRPVPLTLNRQRSILVVDDEDAVRTGIRKFLEKVGYDVREAWSGRSALAQLTAGSPPELVLTDLKMTDGSGYWFLDQLARDFPTLLERTLVLTGDTEHAEVAEMAARTGVPVLRKPLELPELLERLDEVARR